jgi:two-component system OmpR family sensor kinase
MRSIRHTLLFLLSAGLCLGILAAAGLTYWQAREEANELFDYQMKQMAASLPSQAFAPLAPAHSDDADLEDDVVIQIWDRAGVPIYHSHANSSLPQQAASGFSNVVTRDGVWRVYSAQRGETIVQVAQPRAARRELAAQTALKTVAPLLLLLPFLAYLIWLAVGRGLAPVQRVAADLKARDSRSLAPLSEAGLPQEIRPLTHALNDLLTRLDQSIRAQSAFVADAAHELRTPLTALKLQMRLAECAESAAERSAAFADLKQGLERANHLVQQLLTLARQEPGAFAPARQPVSLGELVRSVIADLALAADEKGIDLGLLHAASATVDGNPDALRILLSNLIDNAIRYTPPGGRVDVSILADAQGAALVVEDNGPGIAETDMDRVQDRFYRVPGTQTQGSGLGLAIVKQVAQVHSATLALQNRGSGGLRATVRFSRRNLVITGEAYGAQNTF